MKIFAIVGCAVLATNQMASAQADSIRVHVERARAAANGPGATLFNLCPAVEGITPPTFANPALPAVAGKPAWYAEPHKVFDNLYWVGQTEYSSWALETSAGIIVIDAIYDYSVEAEIADGLKQLGLDPSTIKYVIISHAHGDHSGGARYLQEHFGAKVILSAADWDLLASGRGNTPKPQRDIVAGDGYKVTLGGDTVTLYLTPGHTPGTLSSIFKVKDNGQTHTVAAWGGTAFNFTITPDKPRDYWFQTYVNSAERFRDIVKRSGADVLVANHTNFDMSKTKLPALAARRPGEPHPYVVGAKGIEEYLTVAAECARAARFATAQSPRSLRIALAKQPFSPTGTSVGPTTMANGGIQDSLAKIGAVIRVNESKLTATQDTEYGAWKRLGWALGDFAKIVSQNERDGYFTVGLYATCPSMPGMVAGLEHSAPNGRTLRVGMLWLDAHPDFNTPETTRSGSMGGMPVAIATGRALSNLRLDATLDPPMRDEDVVMGGIRLTDPLEKDLLDHSKIQQLTVDDLRRMTPAVWRQLDRLNAQVDKLYIHIDMDVLDPREVSMHVNLSSTVGSEAWNSRDLKSRPH